MAHITPVDEKILQCTPLACRLGFSHISVYRHDRRLDLYGQELLVEAFPEKRNDTLAKRTGEETVHFFVVMRQNKLYLGVCQCDAFKFVGDITILYLIVFQKLATSRHIKEEIFHGKVATRLHRNTLLRLTARSSHAQTCTQLILGTTGAQLHLRNGNNRCQRFASEPHRMQRKQIVGLLDFRRRVPLECQAGIGRRHSRTVVDDLNKRTPRLFQNDTDMSSTGVNGILHQLLDYRRRALYHLSGSYLVGNRIG